MSTDEIAGRRAELVRQFEAAKAKKSEAEALLGQAQRLLDSIDGAIQENNYWLNVAKQASYWTQVLDRAGEIAETPQEAGVAAEAGGE